MGRGDLKTRKGKTSRRSHGKTRLKSKSIKAKKKAQE
jgi:ribosomal small subunit protein bTHX